jgi:hypothetical protein
MAWGRNTTGDNEIGKSETAATMLLMTTLVVIIRLWKTSFQLIVLSSQSETDYFVSTRGSG